MGLSAAISGSIKYICFAYYHNGKFFSTTFERLFRLHEESEYWGCLDSCILFCLGWDDSDASDSPEVYCNMVLPNCNLKICRLNENENFATSSGSDSSSEDCCSTEGYVEADMDAMEYMAQGRTKLAVTRI